jgi:hypothetical protein
MPGGRFTIGQVAEGAARNRLAGGADPPTSCVKGTDNRRLQPAGSSAGSHRWATAATDGAFLSERRMHHRRELFDEEGLGQEVIHPTLQLLERERVFCWLVAL